ncbi:phosphatidylserine decarboxylase family protein [Chondrinema litorale]|uniref:phosphatidylserine decarboxylase family protein n=1 Tax=Chondrinema litorale TaxID=2994555 RepID=UPI002544493A|nr:phosphatidylserine decarboxylase family protein [Chondrinema litorale]UZR95162.1 phosphatidylserine decarboxylase family protein [Chondrinema litorale]
MTIHKEGFTILVITILAIVALNGVLYYFFGDQRILMNISFIASTIFFLLILQFFRSPRVITSIDSNLVYAPADGKVVVIEEVEEKEFLKENRRQISIFMSPINVHVNRNPISGVVKYVKYHAGKYLVAWHPKSSTENERTTIVVENENGISILFRQIAGAMAKRIKWYVEEGQPVVQGEEFGFIKFGSRVDVFVPLDAEICVNLNQKTKGGKTILAKLKV